MAAAVPAVPAVPSPEEHPDVPFFVQSWIRSLLDPEVLDLLRAAGERQVEVRLLASKGRVRRRPAVLFDTGGHQEMIKPSEVS